jgi:hypothetical protein
MQALVVEMPYNKNIRKMTPGSLLYAREPTTTASTASVGARIVETQDGNPTLKMFLLVIMAMTNACRVKMTM